MKEHPILFSTPMVQAILKGSKTQTRRVIKYPSYFKSPDECNIRPGVNCWFADSKVMNSWNLPDQQLYFKCSYGQVGDRLWVRETWYAEGTPYCDLKTGVGCKVEYKADDKENWQGIWRPSIFLPRWASRITLEITDIRVQKVQEITKEDVIAEGITPDFYYRTALCWWYEFYSELWDTINSKRGYSWEVNPWVWAITFKLLTPQLT